MPVKWLRWYDVCFSSFECLSSSFLSNSLCNQTCCDSGDEEPKYHTMIDSLARTILIIICVFLNLNDTCFMCVWRMETHMSTGLRPKAVSICFLSGGVAVYETPSECEVGSLYVTVKPFCNVLHTSRCAHHLQPSASICWPYMEPPPPTALPAPTLAKTLAH